MHNNTIIDLDTFKIIDNPRYVIVDSLIANTILTLNKLGYKTNYSCCGKLETPKKELFINQDLNLLDGVKKENKSDIEIIRNNSFDFWQEWTYTEIYISFDKEYNFDKLPDGFIKDDNCIRHKIEFYVGKKRRDLKDIQKELEKFNKILYEWAEKLPKVK